MTDEISGARGLVPFRHSPRPRGRALVLSVAAISLALAASACVAAQPASAPSASTAASASPSVPGPGQPGSDVVASARPSASLPSAAEPSSAGGSPGRPGGTSTGGTVHNPLIICVGPDQGPPCVQADDAAWVIAAEAALPSAERQLVAQARVEPTQSCPAGAPAAACGAGTSPEAIVTFVRSDGSKVGQVFVYRTAAGQLAAALL